jgi:hypothetical protein
VLITVVPPTTIVNLSQFVSEPHPYSNLMEDVCFAVNVIVAVVLSMFLLLFSRVPPLYTKVYDPLDDVKYLETFDSVMVAEVIATPT